MASMPEETTRRGDDYDETELRDILADWYEEELFDLPTNDALQKLIAICEDKSVRLYPLAKTLRECLITSAPRAALSGR